MPLRIKNWKKFQHFKNRRPPWIKLYREILEDPDWHALDGNSAKSLVMLWLIASENDGELPGRKKLSFRLRISDSHLTVLLSKVSHWIEGDDINVISSCHQDDTPEQETEGETEGETDTRIREKDSNSGKLQFRGTKLHITETEHKALASAFEGADLVAEYLRMDCWLVTNHRSYRSFGRFANTWMSRARIPIIRGDGNGQATSKHIERQRRVFEERERALSGGGGLDDQNFYLPSAGSKPS